jgi:hypothetical protein
MQYFAEKLHEIIVESTFTTATKLDYNEEKLNNL